MKHLSKILWIAIILEGMATPIFGQEEDHETLVIQYLTDNNAFRDLIENQGQEVYDLILSPNKSVSDINTITMEELRENFFLDESQIRNFIDYRDKYGAIRSIYELQVIEGFDRETISLFMLSVAAPYKVKIHTDTKDASQSFSIGTQWLIQKEKGFIDQNKFKGDPLKVFSRYSLNIKNKIIVRFTGEKDQGEYFTFNPKRNKYFFDHYSAFIQLRNIGKISDIIIGDFSLQTGQGLVFSQPFSFGKGVETINSIRKSGSRLRPVSSSYEYKNFSGVAGNLRLKNLNLTAFISHVKRDATIWGLDINQPYIRSLNQSGLHRTDSEIEKEDALSENSAGLNVDYFSKNKNINTGVNFLHTSYSLPFNHLKSPDNQYKFYGYSNQNASTYFNYYLSKTHFFSEFGISKSKGLGFVSGLIHQVKESFFISAFYRNLSPNYHSFHGNTFSESSTMSNEKGLYLGLKFSPVKNTTIGIYHDTYSFPYPKSNLSKATQGSDWMTFIRYQKYKSYAVNLKLNYQTEEQKESSGLNSPFAPTGFSNRTRIDLLGRINASEHLELIQQIKWSMINQGPFTTNGFLMSTGIRITKEKISMNATFSLFNIEDYSNRIYLYQQGVVHGYLYPFFFNDGSSLNLLVNYRFNETIKFWVNFNQVLLNDVKTIGSGNDQINGNKKSIVSLETVVNF